MKKKKQEKKGSEEQGQEVVGFFTCRRSRARFS